MSIATDLFDLTGEVALITGASSGLGWRFAQVLAGQGAKVVLAARRTQRLESLKQKIEDAGDVAHCLALDVAEEKNIAAAFDEVENVFGPVTIMVNNAGLAVEKFALETSMDDWRRTMAVNMDAVWLCSQQATRRMIAAGKPGSIINISSILAQQVMPSLAAYSVSKAAVSQMTKAMAVEFARHNIRVNAIAPGYVVTEINQQALQSRQGEALKKRIPQRRFADPHDLDGTLLLLASSKASGFMTGEVIVVDGGHSLAV